MTFGFPKWPRNGRNRGQPFSRKSSESPRAVQPGCCPSVVDFSKLFKNLKFGDLCKPQRNID